MFVYLNLCYKMRALGYPPGWMMEVQKNKALVLNMFGKDGNGWMIEVKKNETPVLAMFGKDGKGRLYINIFI